MLLTDNPQDYGLPFPRWYGNQRDAAQRCVNLAKGEILVVEGPTGTGKSALPAATSHFRPGTTVLMSTRDLQAQYEASFSDFAVVWGQEHYPCVWEEHKEEFHSVYHANPSRLECPFRTPVERRDCPAYLDCPYEAAKCRALSARAKVLNYAYALYSQWWRRDGREWDLFCDEAHRLSDVLSDLISVSVSSQTRRKWGLPPFPQVTPSGAGRRKAYQQAVSWLAKAEQCLKPIVDSKDIVSAKRAERFYNNIKQLRETLDYAEPFTWHITSDAKRFVARPVIPGLYAHRLLDHRARSMVFMSATIGDPKVLLSDLGLGDREFQFVTYPHIFPRENRPVFWVRECPRIRRKTTDSEYEKQAEIIAGIIGMHKGEKGLVHTMSWHHARRLMELLSHNGVGDRLMLAEGARLETVEKFKQSDGDTVAISPSWQEGLNFPDAECRFAVIAKTMFPDAGNPIVRMRMARKSGNDWYKWKAALKVVQAAGRGVRHAEDYCVTYIADGTWYQVQRYAPKWFQDAVEVI